MGKLKGLQMQTIRELYDALFVLPQPNVPLFELEKRKTAFTLFYYLHADHCTSSGISPHPQSDLARSQLGLEMRTLLQVPTEVALVLQTSKVEKRKNAANALPTKELAGAPVTVKFQTFLPFQDTLRAIRENSVAEFARVILEDRSLSGHPLR
mmetsp:Transcript_8962/g.14158  ORF Transcript_8962/g.14158 Transcript_8962/m.14158 type:complete len:153 (-) Transcript_8962:1572-2030(-)